MSKKKLLLVLQLGLSVRRLDRMGGPAKGVFLKVFGRQIEKGEKKGKKRGEKKGRKKFLMVLLQEKFGELPAWALGKLEKAGPIKLEVLGCATLGQDTLEKVFSF